MLAYWAMTLRTAFSTAGGTRPATLVMMSCSSSSGSEGSLSVFIRVETHCFTWGESHATARSRCCLDGHYNRTQNKYNYTTRAGSYIYI